MKCRSCGETFPANIHTCAPGGFSSPGTFFIVNMILLLAGVCAVTLGYVIFSVVLGLMLLIGLGANLTSWTDANCHMGAGGERVAGLDCPKCGHVNAVRPWSL